MLIACKCHQVYEQLHYREGLEPNDDEPLETTPRFKASLMASNGPFFSITTFPLVPSDNVNPMRKVE